MQRHRVLSPWCMSAFACPKTSFEENKWEKRTLCGLDASRPFPRFSLVASLVFLLTRVKDLTPFILN